MISVPFDRSFRSGDGDHEELSPPSGFAFTPGGQLVLSDDFNHRIQVYNGDQLVKSFGEKGKENGQFHYPKGIAVDADGNIYVADSWNHRVQKFDAEGNHRLTFGSCGEGRGELNEPYDILIEPSGNILVVERYNHRIQWFSPEGESLGWLGQRGTVLEEHLASFFETTANLFSPPAFEFPTSIDRDSHGNRFITDSGNHRIVKFDANWKRVLTFGERGEGDGRFQYPLCVAVGKNDMLYITDLNNNRIQVFTPFGHHLGALDRADEKTPLKAPCLTAIDPQGKLHAGLTFNSSVFSFSPSDDSLESVAAGQAMSDAQNPAWSILQGQLAEQEGNLSKAGQAYEQAIQLLWLEEDDARKAERFDDEPLLRLGRLALGETDSPNREAALLKGIEVFARRLRISRENLFNTFEAWGEIALTLSAKSFKEQLDILNEQEDPRVFNQELFDAEKKDKILFRQIREASYVHCRLSNRMAEYLGDLVSASLSDAAVQAVCDDLTGRLSELGESIASRIRDKESKEMAMIQAFSEMQENQAKWEVFLTNFHCNNRTMCLLAPLLLELRTLLLALKCSAQATTGNPITGKTLARVVGKSPHNQVIPKILLGIQENRPAHSILDTLWRDLNDLWTAHWEDSEEPVTRSPDLDYFSPLPFDVEDLDIEEIVRSYRLEGAVFEKMASGLVVGGEVYPTDSLADTLPQKLVEVLDAQTAYEEKNRELLQQLDDLNKQRRDLDKQLKQVNPQDKRTPITLNNNIAIVEFQVALLRRMILTLEVNENRNFNRLILGSALLAANEKTGNHPTAKDFYKKLADFHSQEQQLVETFSRERKSANFQWVDLASQQTLLNLGENIETIDRSIQLGEELADAHMKLENLEFNLMLHARTRNRLSRLFDFLRDTGAYDKTASFAPLAPAFGHTLTRTGPQIGTLAQPMGLAFDPEGHLFMVDEENHHVCRITQHGVCLARFGGWGNGPGTFRYPVSAQVDRQGNVYVVDLNNQRVQKFSPDGTFLAAFGDRGDPEQRLGPIFSSSIDSEDKLWIADTTHQRLQVYGPEGQLAKSITPETIDQPVGLCCLENGEYLVADRSDHLLKRFNAEGKLTGGLKREGTGFDDLYIISFDPTHGIFASDHWSSRILHLDTGLNVLGVYGGTGKRMGEFNKVGWMSVHKNLLAVADMGNFRIQIFDLKKTLAR
ncbi:hypothetical protein UZ36_01425 [Candidatus Nitromaritima sp. SCGC AAA799-C22]|nr:hypothetical protein UZ36_01425 [Candidatus Nitromaritima sp. SCGC AAA799-C22]